MAVGDEFLVGTEFGTDFRMVSSDPKATTASATASEFSWNL